MNNTYLITTIVIYLWWFTMNSSFNCWCSIKALVNDGSSKKKKCITGLCDLDIPWELLQEILSHLGLKDNIKASAVCKTWFLAAVSVRKSQTLPWLFYSSENGDYYIFDPSRSQRLKQNIPELKGHGPVYCRDGWLLMAMNSPLELDFFLNPFTRECIYLPIRLRFFSGKCSVFSAAPTSTICLVVPSYQFQRSFCDLYLAAWWNRMDHPSL